MNNMQKTLLTGIISSLLTIAALYAIDFVRNIEPQFHYGDKVVLRGGFYRGVTGEVRSRHWSESRYMVRFGVGEFEWIDASDMELVK